MTGRQMRRPSNHGLWSALPKRSLAYHDRSLLIVVGFAAAYALLYLGLTTPVFTVRTGWSIFAKETSYSIVDSVARLAQSGEAVIAGIVLAFSVALPVAKNALIALLYFADLTDDRVRKGQMALVERTAKWSMVDVFVVALLIVMVSNEQLAIANSGVGLLYFAGSLAVSAALYYAIKAKLPAKRRRASGRSGA